MSEIARFGIDGILMDNAGNFLKASISLSFVEYSTGSDDDEMQIIYQGVDIYRDISLNQCVHDMYAASRSDELTFKFNDLNKLWDGWSPKNNDTIEVISGSATTGKMPIESVKPENGLMVLRALSIPLTAKNKSSKSWGKSSFHSSAKRLPAAIS